MVIDILEWIEKILQHLIIDRPTVDCHQLALTSLNNVAFLPQILMNASGHSGRGTSSRSILGSRSHICDENVLRCHAMLLRKIHTLSCEDEFAEHFEPFLLILAEETLIAFVIRRHTIIASVSVAVTMAML